MRSLDSVQECSNAFLLPELLQDRLLCFDRNDIEGRLAGIRESIDQIAFDLYGLGEEDRQIIYRGNNLYTPEDDSPSEDDEDESEAEPAAPADSALEVLSWSVGVAFGRFDLRLAIGERKAPQEPDPFGPLPVKSPGMRPDGADPFHNHVGVLVSDQGNPHDLAHLVEEVLTRVNVAVSEEVRRWLQKDFFVFHLKRYSRSRRKAPIYWPLSTATGSYILWVFYPTLNDQTLFIAINDFVDPKLRQVDSEVSELRKKGSARSRDDETRFEAQQAFQLELTELRGALLDLAPTYKPNQDDGVQISAAPLWPLFRHKPWQKIMKDTWAKLERGDYDWTHLAMNYWPDRVQEKCKTDKSLAIAHGLEHLYVEPAAKAKKARGRKKAGDAE